MLTCEFNGQKVNCGTDFEVVVTDYGFCCSFNVIPYSTSIRKEAQTIFSRGDAVSTAAHDEELEDLVIDSYQPVPGQICKRTPLETGAYDQVCNAYNGMV